MKHRLYLPLTLLFLIFLSDCAGFGDSMNSFDATLNSIAKKTGTEFENEIPFSRYAGFGGSLSSDHVIIHEEIIFTIKKHISKDESIILISKVIELYLKNIYAEKQLANYLKQHPFTYKNLMVVFFILDGEGKNAFHPDIGDITLREGKMFYRTVSKSEGFLYKVESYVEESYEESAKRLGVWKN